MNGMDNTKSLKTNLDKTLKDNGVTKIYVMGLATYCVYYSVVDALSLGYMVMLLEDATKRISANGTKQVLKDMT
jgi:nicotinamidase/pyrazinamidase